MARRTSSPPNPPDWTPKQTSIALQKQLDALDSFRARTYQEVEHEEQGWINFTVNILAHGFGEGSNNVKQFH
jgi:hypothetical protein